MSNVASPLTFLLLKLERYDVCNLFVEFIVCIHFCSSLISDDEDMYKEKGGDSDDDKYKEQGVEDEDGLRKALNSDEEDEEDEDKDKKEGEENDEEETEKAKEKAKTGKMEDYIWYKE